MCSITKYSLSEIQEHARIAFASKMFKTMINAEQISVKMMLGHELGLTPFQAVQQIHVFEANGGLKIQCSGNLIASKIKSSGKYDYEVIEHDHTICRIKFWQGDKELGIYSFSIKDAERANLTKKLNWIQYPRDMLFNRCISGGYKVYTPDILNLTVYTVADDFMDDSEMLEEGVDYTVTTKIINEEQKAQAQESATKISAAIKTNKPTDRPYEPEKLKSKLNAGYKAKKPSELTPATAEKLQTEIFDVFEQDEINILLNFVFGSTQIDEGKAQCLLNWDSDHEFAYQELQKVKKL